MKLQFPITAPNTLVLELTDLLLNKYPTLNLNKIKDLLDCHLNIYCYIKVQTKDDYGYSKINKIEFENISIDTTINKIRFNYRTILYNLVQLNYILINETYSFKCENTNISKSIELNFPKSYKILKYKDDSYINHYINFKESLDKCVNITTKKEWIELYPEHKNFIESTYKTKILLTKYKNYLELHLGERFKKDLKRIGYKKNKSFQYKVENILDERVLEEFLFEATKINLGMIWFAVSDEGRLYTSLTTLSSTHISFLRYGNKCSNLTYFDAKSCQPLILSFKINNPKYKECVESGYFYETIKNEYNKLYNTNKTRNEIKDIVYKEVLFDDANPVSLRLTKIFNNLFGEDVVIKINELKKEEIYTITQKIESEIFINGFKKWNKYIITRHDGIFIEEKNKEIAEQIIREGFLEYNLNVKIKEINSLEYNEVESSFIDKNKK